MLNPNILKISILPLLFSKLFLFSEIQNYDPPPIHPSDEYQVQNAITYTFSGGYFGDNLVSYIHAKWFAMKYNMVLLHKPFEHSDKLNLDNIDPKFNDSYKFQNRIEVIDESQIDPNMSSTLYVVHYTAVLPFEREMYTHLPNFQIDYEDPIYKNEIKRCISAKENVQTVKLPKDKINIGLHIRVPLQFYRGGESQIYLGWPLKFPPISYYITQLKRVLKYYPIENLYVYIFTNDLNPEKIVKKFRKHFSKYKRVQFNYNQNNMNPEQNLFFDFYSMSKFNAFIGPGSNFSMVATLLGDYDLKIIPSHSIVKDDVISIDKVEIHYRSKKTGKIKIQEIDN